MILTIIFVLIGTSVAQEDSKLKLLQDLSNSQIESVRNELIRSASNECADKLNSAKNFLVCATNSAKRRFSRQDDGDFGGGGDDEGDPLFEVPPAVPQVIGLLTEAFTGINSVVNQTSGAQSLPSFIFSKFSNLFGSVTGINGPPTPPARFPVPPRERPAWRPTVFRPGVTTSTTVSTKPVTQAEVKTTKPPTRTGSSPHFLGQDTATNFGSGQFFPLPISKARPTKPSSTTAKVVITYTTEAVTAKTITEREQNSGFHSALLDSILKPKTAKPKPTTVHFSDHTTTESLLFQKIPPSTESIQTTTTNKIIPSTLGPEPEKDEPKLSHSQTETLVTTQWPEILTPSISINNRRPVIIHNMYYPDLETALNARSSTTERTRTTSFSELEQTTSVPRVYKAHSVF